MDQNKDHPIQDGYVRLHCPYKSNDYKMKPSLQTLYRAVSQMHACEDNSESIEIYTSTDEFKSVIFRVKLRTLVDIVNSYIDNVLDYDVEINYGRDRIYTLTENVRKHCVEARSNAVDYRNHGGKFDFVNFHYIVQNL